MPINLKNPADGSSSSSSGSSISVSEETGDSKLKRNWSISPKSEPIIWQEGTEYEGKKIITITYPSEGELKKLHEEGLYDKYLYSFYCESPEFFDIESTYPASDVNLDENGNLRISINFKNFNSLPTDSFHTKSISFYVSGFKKKGFGGEQVVLTQTEYVLSLKRIPKTKDSSVDVPEDVFIVYNKSADQITGQTQINLNSNKSFITVDFLESNDMLRLSSVENGMFNVLKGDSISQAPANGEMLSYPMAVKIGESVVGIIKIYLKIIDVDVSFVKNKLRLDYNFCLDDNKITVIKSNKKSDRVSVRMTMSYKYYDRPSYEVTQVYEYVYFNGKVDVYPGEEIHDFFDSLSSKFLKPELIEVSSDLKAIRVNSIFKCCSVDIELTETNDKGEIFNTAIFRDTRWIPGKRPAGFPYLTEGVERNTYSDSILSICAVSKDYKQNQLNRIIGATDDSDIKTEWDIVQMLFKRGEVLGSSAEQSVLSNSFLWLEPVLEPDGVINVIFENQNKVPDWFSFTDVYEIQPEFEFNITPNISRGIERKTDVTRKEIIKLNTGWFRYSEFKLINDLMSSSLCYINIEGKWIPAMPISKKPLAYNSVEKLAQQYVEFQIIRNER